MSRALATIALLGAACAPRAIVVAPPAPVPQPYDSAAALPVPPPVTPVPPTGSGVRFGPGALRYMVHQQVRMEHDRPDMPPTSQLGWRTFVATTVTGPTETAGYPAIFTIDSIKPDSGVTLPPWMDLAAARGLRFVGHLAPTGEFRGGRATDSAVAENVAMLVGRFQTFYPRIPAAGVSLGDSWTDTLTLTERGAGRLTVRKTIRRVHAAAWEETPAGRALRLEVSEHYDVTESGSGGGQPFEAKGSGVSASVERVGAGGRFLGTVARDSTNLTITLTAQGLTIPRRQITTTTVTVLP